jgi:hypothetical protein
MRRKRSDELPRYVNDGAPPPFQWPRRSRLFAVSGILFLYWFFLTGHETSLTNIDTTNWSRYAYSLYATDSATLCHAVLIFDALARLGSKADRVLFYPKYWDTVVSNGKDRDSQLLVMARDRFGVKLMPVALLSVPGRTEGKLFNPILT